MNKAIIMSIQPKWLAKILNGEKTIEIRKTMPKRELPIDVYLYCTKDTKLQWAIGCLPVAWGQGERNERLLDKTMNGKVVAKFALNKCYELEFDGEDWNTYYRKNTIISASELERKSCLTQCEMEEYAGGKNIYAWHIDNLVIFDKPMELSEFEKEEYYSTPNGWFPSFQSLTKAPQSWQYVWLK